MINMVGLGSMTFSLSALVIAFTCLFYTLVMRKKVRLKNRLFLTFVIIVIVDSLAVMCAEPLQISGLDENLKLILFDVLHCAFLCTVHLSCVQRILQIQ